MTRFKSHSANGRLSSFIPGPFTPAYRLLIACTLLLIIAFQSLSQTTTTINKGASLKELKGHYSILWNSTVNGGNGEGLIINRNSFDYQVFSVGSGIGYTEKTIAKGKFNLLGDTIFLTINRNDSPKAEFLSLKTKYLIRKIEDNHKTFISLVPISKADSLQSIINILPKEIEKSLWIEKIFTKEIKPL
jgi:hypothetical protein